MNIGQAFPTFTDFNGIVTWIWLLFTIIYAWLQLRSFRAKLVPIRAVIQNITGDFSLELMSENSILHQSWINYSSTFLASDGERRKTQEDAELFFNDQLLSKNVNLRWYQSVTGLLVGFGILGTFVGLTFGIAFVSTTSIDAIKTSIEAVLQGMKTAFWTSIVGMTCSMIYGWREKELLKDTTNEIQNLCDELNARFKITTADILRFAQHDQMQIVSQIITSWREMFLYRDANGAEILPGRVFYSLLAQAKEHHQAIESVGESLRSTLEDMFIAQDDGNRILPAFVLRDLRREAEQQTKALKSFSTDLADGIRISTQTIGELQSALQHIVSTSLNENLVPALDRVEAAVHDVRTVKEESSASVIQQMAANLQDAMRRIAEEFQTSLSGSAISQIENLARIVEGAGASLSTFPHYLESTMSAIQQQVDQTRGLLESSTRKLNQETEAKWEAIQQVLESLLANLHESIAESQRVIRDSSSKASEDAAAATDMMRQQTEDTAAKFSSVITEIQRNVESLLERQQQDTNRLQSLIGNYRDVLTAGTTLTGTLNGVIQKWQTALGQFAGLSSQLTSGADTLKATSSQLDTATKKFIDQNQAILTTQQQTIERLRSALTDAERVASDYATKFQTIEQGLSGIFGKIQSGLTQYQNTTRDELNKTLEQFTRNLADAVSALHGAVEGLGEVVEQATDIRDQRTSTNRR